MDTRPLSPHVAALEERRRRQQQREADQDTTPQPPAEVNRPSMPPEGPPRLFGTASSIDSELLQLGTSYGRLTTRTTTLGAGGDGAAGTARYRGSSPDFPLPSCSAGHSPTIVDDPPIGRLSSPAREVASLPPPRRSGQRGGEGGGGAGPRPSAGLPLGPPPNKSTYQQKQRHSSGSGSGSNDNGRGSHSSARDSTPSSSDDTMRHRRLAANDVSAISSAHLQRSQLYPAAMLLSPVPTADAVAAAGRRRAVAAARLAARAARQLLLRYYLRWYAVRVERRLSCQGKPSRGGTCHASGGQAQEGGYAAPAPNVRASATPAAVSRPDVPPRTFWYVDVKTTQTKGGPPSTHSSAGQEGASSQRRRWRCGDCGAGVEGHRFQASPVRRMGPASASIGPASPPRGTTTAASAAASHSSSDPASPFYRGSAIAGEGCGGSTGAPAVLLYDDSDRYFASLDPAAVDARYTLGTAPALQTAARADERRGGVVLCESCRMQADAARRTAARRAGLPVPRPLSPPVATTRTPSAKRAYSASAAPPRLSYSSAFARRQTLRSHQDAHQQRHQHPGPGSGDGGGVRYATPQGPRFHHSAGRVSPDTGPRDGGSAMDRLQGCKSGGPTMRRLVHSASSTSTPMQPPVGGEAPCGPAQHPPQPLRRGVTWERLHELQTAVRAGDPFVAAAAAITDNLLGDVPQARSPRLEKGRGMWRGEKTTHETTTMAIRPNHKRQQQHQHADVEGFWPSSATHRTHPHNATVTVVAPMRGSDSGSKMQPAAAAHTRGTSRHTSKTTAGRADDDHEQVQRSSGGVEQRDALRASLQRLLVIAEDLRQRERVRSEAHNLCRSADRQGEHWSRAEAAATRPFSVGEAPACGDDGGENILMAKLPPFKARVRSQTTTDTHLKHLYW